MEKQGTTKRQHYVPQMILRNFSKDSATTSLMVLSTGKRVHSAPINRQCYEPYFYGSDQIMEQSFAAEESKIARHLGDLSRATLEGLPDSAIHDLKLFVHYQQARTRGAAEHVSKFAAAFMKSAIRGTAKLNHDSNLHPEDIDRVDIRLKNAQHQSIWMATKTTPLLRDMVVKFIITERTAGFVIADHPVVAYNQFAEHHPRLRHYPTITAIALKGLQLFMPLSPSVTLAVYDLTTYEYGGKNRICRAGPEDIRHLNEMQAINAWECIFLDKDRADDATLEMLTQARKKHPSRYKMNVAESEMALREDGKISQLVVVNHTDIRIGAKLSFVRTIDGHSYERYEGTTIPERSPRLMDLTMLYGQYLEEEVKRRRSPTEGT